MAVRHCTGENAQVYEITGKDLPSLFREAADLVDEQGSWVHGVALHQYIGDENDVAMVLTLG